MSFDPTTWRDTPAPVIEDEPQIVTNMRELRDLLRLEDSWSKRWSWDFSAVSRGCLSVGCAFGLWDFVSVAHCHSLDFVDPLPPRTTSSIFGFGIAEGYGDVRDYGVKSLCDVTPSMVADRIDQWLKEEAPTS